MSSAGACAGTLPARYPHRATEPAPPGPLSTCGLQLAGERQSPKRQKAAASLTAVRFFSEFVPLRNSARETSPLVSDARPADATRGGSLGPRESNDRGLRRAVSITGSPRGWKRKPGIRLARPLHSTACGRPGVPSSQANQYGRRAAAWQLRCRESTAGTGPRIGENGRTWKVGRDLSAWADCTSRRETSGISGRNGSMTCTTWEDRIESFGLVRHGENAVRRNRREPT